MYKAGLLEAQSPQCCPTPPNTKTCCVKALLTLKSLSRSSGTRTVSRPSRRGTAHGKTSCPCVWTGARTRGTRTASPRSGRACAGSGDTRRGTLSRKCHSRRAAGSSPACAGCPSPARRVAASRSPSDPGGTSTTSRPPMTGCHRGCVRRRWRLRAGLRGSSSARLRWKLSRRCRTETARCLSGCCGWSEAPPRHHQLSLVAPCSSWTPGSRRRRDEACSPLVPRSGTRAVRPQPPASAPTTLRRLPATRRRRRPHSLPWTSAHC